MPINATHDETHGLSLWARVCARVRMPILAVAVLAFVAGLVFDLPEWWRWASIALFLSGMALYVRLGTPRGDAVDLGSPVRGRWMALNSPTSKVPSHSLHGWAQTYAIDLVRDPADDSRPEFSWWPLARRPEDFPGFGEPILSPVAGVVVRARSALRDHWSRTSPPGLAYLVVESVRELIGPDGVLGNHVVIRRDDGVHVLLAHLRHGSVRVRKGERVARADVVGECGNSGNTTEPHVHVQAMDRPSVWLAAGLPVRFDGAAPPPNGSALAPA